MKLPKNLYEVVPYAYIAVGIVLLVSDLHLFARIAGVLLYCAGACYWILRSNYRRDDRYSVQARAPDFALSAIIYEAQPFFYILCGIILLLQFATAFELFSGFCLLSAGLLVWRLRYAFRLEEHKRMILRNKAH